MPEIDENQLAAFRAYDDFYRKASSNPAHRKLLKQLEKAVYPEAAVPEIDAAAAVEAKIDEKLSALDEKLEAFNKREAERDERMKTEEIARRWAAGQAAARARGYTDEGMKQLEELMQEKGIFDHEVAIPYFERLHPPAEPATVGQGDRWNFFDSQTPDNDSWKKLLESNNDEVFLNEMIPTALKDVRGR